MHADRGRSRARPFLGMFLLASIGLALLLFAPAEAQRRYLGIGHTLRLEGVVEPAEDADVLGEIRIRAEKEVRRFGVMSAIAPGEDGMAIFRNQNLYPVTFNLVANEKMMQAFQDAAPGTKLHMMGVLQPDSFLLASLDVVDPAP